MINVFLMIWTGVFGLQHSQSAENEASVFGAEILLSYVLDLDSPGTPSATAPGDFFGFSSATGDFNGDGIDDLAVGIPGWDFNVGVDDTGMVMVVYGTFNGIPSQSVELTQSLLLDSDGLEPGDLFGGTLAVGDFDGDGYDDLVVGTENEDVTTDFNDPNNTTFVNAGAINIFYGSSSGIETDSDYIHIDIDDPFSGDLLQDEARFGHALTVGNFNNDDWDDLVVSVHRQDVVFDDINNPVMDAGMVVIYNGHPLGIRNTDRDILSQANGALSGVPEVQDYFGISLVAGNFNNDDYDDLVIGVPYEDYNGVIDAGIVQVLYGASNGLVFNNEIWSQDDLFGVVLEVNDLFGFSMTTGNINGDGFDDLIVSAAYEDIESLVDAGVVHSILGSSGGLQVASNQTVSQNDGTLFGVAETGDVFGLSLHAADLNYDGFDEVIIGTPFEDTAMNAGGIVHVIFGTAGGMDINDTQHFLSDELDANFGFSLTSGNYGQGSTLTMGKPGNESNDMDPLAGSIFNLVYKNPDVIFKDGFDQPPKF
ncbi:integrin alpha [Marinicella meishanensis]|uniref:integrin alpha n=1 Tax=Marinicella meishanensis TaxID=2873263 RepID=UPI001CBF385E|nr:integrin alpha [Marinicella sp. NBU2979]